MEACGKLGDILVDAAGVIVARGKADLLGKQRDLLYKLALLLGGKKRKIGAVYIRHLVPVGGKRRKHGAYSRMGILDVVNGVLAVLTHGEVEVELDGRLGT